MASLHGSEQVVDNIHGARPQKGLRSPVAEAKRTGDATQAVGGDPSVDQHRETSRTHQVDEKCVCYAPVRIQAVEEVLYPDGDDSTTLCQLWYGLEG